MAWGLGGLGFKSGGLRAATQKVGIGLSKPTTKPLGQKLGTLASAFALQIKSKTQPIPSDAAVVAKEKRTIIINRPSVCSTFSSPLSNPRLGMSRNIKKQESPAVKHDKQFKPLPPKAKVQPYRPAWGAFRWGG